MAYDKRADGMLEVGPHVEERGAFRGADPLVAIACVICSAQLVQVQGQHSGRVSAVHKSFDATSSKFANQSFHWEDKRGRAGDVIQQSNPGAGGN